MFSIIGLTILVGVAAIAIAIYYSSIKDVTPGQSQAGAGDNCACYYSVNSAGTTCEPTGATYFKTGVEGSDGTCSAVCADLTTDQSTLDITVSGTTQNLFPRECHNEGTELCPADQISVGNNICCKPLTSMTGSNLSCTLPYDQFTTDPSDPYRSGDTLCTNMVAVGPLQSLLTTKLDKGVPTTIKAYIQTTMPINDGSTDPATVVKCDTVGACDSTLNSNVRLNINSNPRNAASIYLYSATTSPEPIYKYEVTWSIIPTDFGITTTRNTMSFNVEFNVTPATTLFPASKACNRTYEVYKEAVTPPTGSISCSGFDATPVTMNSTIENNRFTQLYATLSVGTGQMTPPHYTFRFDIRNALSGATINSVIPVTGPQNGASAVLYDSATLRGNNFRSSINGTPIPFPGLPAPAAGETSVNYTVTMVVVPADNPFAGAVMAPCPVETITVTSERQVTPTTCRVVLAPSTSSTGSLTLTMVGIYTNADIASGAATTATFSFPQSSPAINPVQNVGLTGGNTCSNPSGTTCLVVPSSGLSAFPTFTHTGTGTNATTYNVAATLSVGSTTIVCDPQITLSVSPQGSSGGATSNFTVSKTGPRCFERVSPSNVGTFTITIRNTDTDAELIRSFKDKLPLGFTYVAGSSRINGTAVADSGVVTTNTVGSSQEITWAQTDGWSIAAGGNIVVTFRATATTSAITGQNQNEVVLDPLNTPVTAANIRTEYVFTVASDCTTPDTGLFDSTEAKIGLGLIALIIGITFYYTSFGANVSENLAATGVAKSAVKISGKVGSATKKANSSIKDKARMLLLKAAYPNKYFEEKTIRKSRKK